MDDQNPPARTINATAAIRVCDIGGWTDTWFARYGAVLNIAVNPCVHVQVRAKQSATVEPRITFHVVEVAKDAPSETTSKNHAGDPLLEAALHYMQPSPAFDLEICVLSDAPAGSSTGTSAAATVAMIGALDRLAGGGMAPSEIARAAHRVETEVLRRQCGIQDQIGAAFGGINYIDIHEYPNATVTPMKIPSTLAWELERRLSLVYLGQGHQSSAVHEMVIRELEGAGPEAAKLSPLRQLARESRDAILAGDLLRFGQAMVKNTESQANLHPALVSAAHSEIIEIARQHEAWGWKVNGAGGEGGSVSILHGPSAWQQHIALRAIEKANPNFRVIRSSLNTDGLRLWESSDVDRDTA